MTLASTAARIQYSPNGSTTIFSFPYLFLVEAHLVVTITTAAGVDTIQTIATQYTTTGEGLHVGGTVIMLTPPASGTTLTIKRIVPITQLTDYIANDSFPAETHEEALDKLTMIAQFHQESLDRAIVFPDTEPAATVNELSNAINRASTLFSFGASGEITYTTIASLISSIDISAGTSIVLGTPGGTVNARTITVNVDSTGVFYKVRCWFVANTVTTPTLTPSLDPPDQHLGGTIEEMTDTNGDATITINHLGSSKSWRLCIEVAGVVLLSDSFSMGS